MTLSMTLRWPTSVKGNNMSVTQSFDSYNAAPNTATTAASNAEYDLKDAQLDEASASADGNFGPGGILSGGIGNLTQQAQNVVCNFH